MFEKGTVIYVVAFEPGDGVAAVGGFDWRTDLQEAHGLLLEHLKDEMSVTPAFDHTLLIRRVTLPRDFADKDAVGTWLDREAFELWTTGLEELSSEGEDD